MAARCVFVPIPHLRGSENGHHMEDLGFKVSFLPIGTQVLMRFYGLFKIAKRQNLLAAIFAARINVAMRGTTVLLAVGWKFPLVIMNAFLLEFSS